jgi:hypothetical protein
MEETQNCTEEFFIQIRQIKVLQLCLIVVPRLTAQNL